MRSRYAEELLEAMRETLASKLADVAGRTDVRDTPAAPVLTKLAADLRALEILGAAD